MTKADPRVEASISFLSLSKMYRKQIEKRQSRIRELKDSAVSITAELSDMPRSSGGPKSRVEESVVKIRALEEEIESIIKTRSEWLNDVLDLIHQIPDDKAQEALILLFIIGESWEDAAKQMNVSIKGLGSCRKKGLVSLYDLISKRGLLLEGMRLVEALTE